jgi:hypothetical protein
MLLIPSGFVCSALVCLEFYSYIEINKIVPRNICYRILKSQDLFTQLVQYVIFEVGLNLMLKSLTTVVINLKCLLERSTRPNFEETELKQYYTHICINTSAMKNGMIPVFHLTS